MRVRKRLGDEVENRMVGEMQQKYNRGTNWCEVEKRTVFVRNRSI
jgi:hypothetical protein